MTEKDKLSRKEAARYLTEIGYRIAPQTLANMAQNNNQGSGPPFTRCGWASVFYLRADLKAWARERMTHVGPKPGPDYQMATRRWRLPRTTA